MTNLTHPQELTRTRHLLSEQKMGNTGNDYINRAIETIDQLVAENAKLKRKAGDMSHD